MKTVRIVRITAIVLGMALATTMASAQAYDSGPQTIALNAKLAESLTLSLSANSVNFTLAAGSATNAGSGNITATTAWVLQPGRTAVSVYAYFASATAALQDTNGDMIPSSAFSIADNAGASTALVNATPYNAALAGLQLGSSTAITGTNRVSNRTDTMAFNINLSTLSQLPAATYTGTLNIQAQATP